MKKIRILFETDGVIRFISHLDLNRVMQHALRRSNLPVWYTEGFNQHLYVTFSNPISLGFLNKCGIMEIKLIDDAFEIQKVAQMLNSCLPKGIRVVEAYESDRSFSDIAFAEYDISFSVESITKIETTLLSDELIAVKKTKAGDKIINLAEYIDKLTISYTNGIADIHMRLPASVSFGINPGLVIDVAVTKSDIKISNLLITRTALLDSKGKIFR